MSQYYYFLFLIFSIIAVMIVLDNNVAVYITLIFKIIKVNTERVFWMIKFHPRNPITNLMMRWKYDKMAKDLIKEYETEVERQSQSSNDNPEID
jgi:hypothetical protein